MSWDPRQLRLWRVGIASVLAFDLLRMAVEIAVVGSSAQLAPVDDLVYTAATSGWVPWLACAVGLAGLVHHARGAARWLGALTALLAAAALFTMNLYVRGEPNESLAHAAVALWGWVGGVVVARVGGLDRRAAEGLAATGAAALLGATYVAAGAIKLANSGLAWLEPVRIQMLAAQYVDLPQPAWLTSLRHIVLENPPLAGAIAVTTVGLEFAGGLYFWGPRTRALLGTGLLAMHAGIWALTGILFPSVMLLLLLMSYPWHRLRARPSPPLSTPPLPRRGWLGVGVVGLMAAAMWVVPLPPPVPPAVHPSYVGFLEQIHGVESAITDRLARGEGRIVESLGPLHTGQVLAGGWSIRRLHVLDESARLTLVGASQGRGAEDADQAGAPQVQLQLVPFPDGAGFKAGWRLGEWFLRHERGDTDPERFEAAMQQLQALLTEAAGEDPAASVRAWTR